jgi:hypothetical protein
VIGRRPPGDIPGRRRIPGITTDQGEAVTVTARFKTLPSGLTHVVRAEVTVPAQQMTVWVLKVDDNRNN